MTFTLLYASYNIYFLIFNLPTSLGNVQIDKQPNFSWRT